MFSWWLRAEDGLERVAPRSRVGQQGGVRVGVHQAVVRRQVCQEIARQRRHVGVVVGAEDPRLARDGDVECLEELGHVRMGGARGYHDDPGRVYYRLDVVERYGYARVGLEVGHVVVEGGDAYR